jgi:2-polyprenyl-3-methyl-5-hydroxy-6-metoxy-1,4-benzoquinol methylase
MFKKSVKPQEYWNERSFKFANYYENPTKFDLIFRKAIFDRFERVLKICKKLDKPTVLDIGSGPGINSINLLKYSNVSFVTGIDFAPKMNKYASDYATKNNLSDSCSFINGDFMSYEWKEKKFDVTIALGVYDYIDNAELFTRKIESLTNNIFIISWPCNGLRMFLRKQRYECPVYYYTEKQIRRYLENCSLVKRYTLHKGKAGWSSVAYL